VKKIKLSEVTDEVSSDKGSNASIIDPTIIASPMQSIQAAEIPIKWEIFQDQSQIVKKEKEE